MGSKSISAIEKIDLKLSPLKLKKRQHLSVLQQRKRTDRVGHLLIFQTFGMQNGEIGLSDENIFTVEEKFNQQKESVLARHSKDVSEDMLTVYRRQKQAYVMIWATVSKIWKSPLIFVKQGVKVKCRNVYINKMLAHALHDIKE